MSAETASFPAAGNACPRCHQPFHCGIHDTGPCACSTLQLSAGLRARLAAHYDGCLCIACLAELAAMPSIAPDPGCP